jgi:hypothetical protein
MGSALLGGLIGAAGSIFGGQTAANAQTQAAQQQAAATQAALALQKDIYNRNTANEQPWMTAGVNALNSYSNATGINGAGPQASWFNNFQNDPYYQNVLKAGTDAVSNSAAAKGTLYGGNTLKAINDYGGNLQMGAYNSRLGQIKDVMGFGQNATNALAGVGSNYANNASSTMTNPQTNGTNNLANAGYYTGNSIIGAGNSMLGAYNQYNNQNAYNAAHGMTPGGYSTNINDYGGFGNGW